MSDTPDWVLPDIDRPTPETFDPDYEAPTFPPPPVRFADWTTQLEAATNERLREWANGGAGEAFPWRETELGDGE